MQQSTVTARHGTDSTPEQLVAIAQLALASAQTSAQQAFAIVHLAIGVVLGDASEQATQLIGQIEHQDLDTTPLIHALTDAITHHAEHAPAIAALINELALGIGQKPND